MSYCSIHTFEISRELSSSEYYLFKDHFYKMGYKIRNNNGNLHIFDFTSEGIRIRLLNNEYFNKLCIIVNLKEVIDNGNLSVDYCYYFAFLCHQLFSQFGSHPL